MSLITILLLLFIGEKTKDVNSLIKDVKPNLFSQNFATDQKNMVVPMVEVHQDIVMWLALPN
jgi:hypothetical protein